MIPEGPVYKTLLNEADKAGEPYNVEAKECVEETVRSLLTIATSTERPGMLLGMIQSGKTKSFLGSIALAIDNGYQLFIVLTKGTKALSTQTYKRLKKTFNTSIEDERLQVFDIMSLHKLSGFELSIPLVLVVKKNKDNLNKLDRLLFDQYPALSGRKTLIIDDEADYASIGFKRTKNESIELQRIMEQINFLRTKLSSVSFLQVTATPYSLYLQPKDLSNNNGDVFQPVRPAFTVLVPTHDQYIGGDFYFDRAQDVGSVASFLYQPVSATELEILHHEDKRRFKIEESLTSKAIHGLRSAITNFIVGATIRRLQAVNQSEKPKRFSFIIHTEAGKQAHAWQEQVIESLIEQLQTAAAGGAPEFEQLVREAYESFVDSVAAASGWLPPVEQVIEESRGYLPAIQVEKVNSENDVKNLLDESGQLELRNRLNIFIGGQILDRGLTIGNLIGFYYGRRTNRFQQDTVLQHSRMYGSRPLSDLAVTRFYTTLDLYNVMRTINDFDAGLRQAFKTGGHEKGVVFIRQEGGRILPCSPNKVLVSSLTTLRAGKRLLPFGFQTGYKTHIGKTIADLDERIGRLQNSTDPDVAVMVDLSAAEQLIRLIEPTIETSDDSAFEWDVKAFLASMEYISRSVAIGTSRGKVALLVRTNRDIGRIRLDGRFEDAPDSGNMGEKYRELDTSAPTLMLFRQRGGKDKGWRDCPFWWPVLYMPQQMGTVVFASDVYDYDEDDSALVED